MAGCLTNFIFDIQKTRRLDRETGASTVKYEVVNRRHLTIDGAPVTVLNIRLECDLDLTPWCLHPEDHPAYLSKKTTQWKVKINKLQTVVTFFFFFYCEGRRIWNPINFLRVNESIGGSQMMTQTSYWTSLGGHLTAERCWDCRRCVMGVAFKPLDFRLTCIRFTPLYWHQLKISH